MSSTSENTFNSFDEYMSKMLDGTITPDEMEKLSQMTDSTAAQELMFDYQKIEDALATVKSTNTTEIPEAFLRTVENTVASKIAAGTTSTILSGGAASVSSTSSAIVGSMTALKMAVLTGVTALTIGGGYWAITSFSSNEDAGIATTQSTTQQQIVTPDATNNVAENIATPPVTSLNTDNSTKGNSDNVIASQAPDKNVTSKEQVKTEKQFIQGAGNIQNPGSPIAAELEKAKKELDEKRSTANDAELMQLYYRAGILYVENGFANPAKEHLDKALQLSRKIQSGQTEGNIYGRLAMLEARQNNIDKAKEYYKKAIEILKPIGGNYERWENELQRLE